MKRLLLLSCFFTATFCSAQQMPNLVPLPASVTIGKGSFSINKNTRIIVEDNQGSTNLTDLLVDHFRSNYNISLAAIKNPGNNWGKNCIVFNKSAASSSKNEAYSINVTAEGIAVTSATDAGLFYGYQTLLQLLPDQRKPPAPIVIPQLSINDAPRFGYRGVHLDVARHFMPVSFVKKFIDYLAAFKFNRFHWHLTDDQGWRIEIKKYPLLTSVGGFRNGTIIGRYPGKGNDGLHYGGSYTQEEIKEVVRYAAERFITIIPEIEMPGHASAAIAAYPKLSCFPEEDTQHPTDCAWSGTTKGKQVQQTWGVFEDVFCPSDYTFNFLQDVLDEVMQLFPAEYVHIGGDECPKESWKRSPFCQQLIKDNQLKDEHGLQSYFIQRVEKYINSKGKKIIGWDEILEGGLAPNATVMSWRGEEGGIEAAKQQHDVIMTPGSHCYIDHAQSANEDSVTIGGYLPLEKVYSYDPIPAALTATQAKHILGAQANLWSEYVKTPGKVEYMAFPRLAAMAEVLWTPKARKSWTGFEQRLPALFARLESKGINHSKAYYELQSAITPSPKYDGIFVSVSSRSATPIWINFDRIDSIFPYKKPVFVNSSGSFLASIDKPALQVDKEFYFNKATAKKISLATPPSTQYTGDGGFTLVNGIQNTRGLDRTTEYIGFEGKDCEAVIDLGKIGPVKKITIHALHQKSSWIWRPESFEAFISNDGTTFTSAGLTDDFDTDVNNTGSMSITTNTANARYIKIKVKHWTTIPDGEAGAGHGAWLFLDEVEVD